MQKEYMCFCQVDWSVVLVVCVWSCVLVIKAIHRGCDCEGITCPACRQARMVGWTIVHIPTEGVIATIRIHVMMWGNSLLVRGKASFGLE